jgi:hypothetical protein
MEPEGSLPHSQVPATCPYPEPARSSPYPHIALPEHPSSNLMSLFRCSGRTEVSVRSEAYCLSVSQQDTFLRRGVVSTSPNPQAGGPPLVGCPQLLIHYIRSYPQYWRLFLHPQPVDAPCRGERDHRRRPRAPITQRLVQRASIRPCSHDWCIRHKHQ